MHVCLTKSMQMHYALQHSRKMDGKQLLQKLMEASGHNPNSLADKLRDRSLQSQLARFLNGKTKQPRKETLEKVATFYGLPAVAFIDNATAKQFAIDRGFITPSGVATNDVIKLDAGNTRAQHTLFDLVIALAQHLASADQGARSAAAALLQHLAIHPENAQATAAHLTNLLEGRALEQPPASTSFR